MNCKFSANDTPNDFCDSLHMFTLNSQTKWKKNSHICLLTIDKEVFGIGQSIIAPNDGQVSKNSCFKLLRFSNTPLLVSRVTHDAIR